MRRGFRPRAKRVHSTLLAMDDVLIDAILDVGASISLTKNPFHIGVVLGEEQRHLPFAPQVTSAQIRMRSGDDGHVLGLSRLFKSGFWAPFGQGPGIAEPQRR